MSRFRLWCRGRLGASFLPSGADIARIMAREGLDMDIEKAQLEPETVFARPLDIVTVGGRARGQKIAALGRWNLTLQDRLRATNEGMAPPAGQTAAEAATIEEIAKALALLQDEEKLNPHS